LEGKWLEVLKELVEYSNKNILGNFELYLVMEERRGEQYIKEVTSGILDIKREDKGIGKGRPTEVPSNHNIHNNNNSQSLSTKPRDKNGRFISSNTAAATTTTPAAFTSSNTTIAAADNTTIKTPTTATTSTTAKSPSPWHNKLRDKHGRFVSSSTVVALS
jgi:hypothetical protein